MNKNEYSLWDAGTLYPTDLPEWSSEASMTAFYATSQGLMMVGSVTLWLSHQYARLVFPSKQTVGW